MSLPAFLLAAARAVHVLGVLSVFGVLLASLLGTAGRWRRYDPIILGGAAAAWLAAAPWLMLQAGEMAGAISPAAMAAAMPAAFWDTGFGHALAVRLALLAAIVVLARWPGIAARLAALALAAAACLAQIDMGHAAAPDGPWQRAAAAAHVLAAGAWIGGLVPLLRALGDNQAAAGRIARRFSLLGIAAVAVLAASGLTQAVILVGGLPGLLGTGYGVTVLAKTALFAALLALAAYHRFALTPKLAGDASARIRLRRSVASETALGITAIAVAAWLAGLPPGAHEQPLWPLPWQFSPDAWDDAAIANRMRAGLLLTGLAVAGGAFAWRRRQLRVAVLAGAALIAAITLAAPVPGAFTIPASPTSFFESPTGFTKASVAAGKPLYSEYCASCHGARGFGDGPANASRLRPLTGFHLLEHTDGEMFWILTAGMPDTAMPGFAGVLSEDQRWVVIDFVRSLAGAEPADIATTLRHHH